MAIGGFSRNVMEETQYLIKTPRTKVWYKRQQVVYFPGDRNVKPAIQRHPAILLQNHKDWCFACQDDIAKYSQTWWMQEGISAPLYNRYRVLTPDPTPPPPRMPPVPPNDNERVQSSEINNCHLDMCIHAVHFPTLNISIVMQIPIIVSTIKIIIQTCWLKKEHPLVSTLSAG
jgi:hypothetical protein